MPVIGPDYSRGQADDAYRKILRMLQKDYNIQRDNSQGILKDWTKDREERNEVLRDAVHKLFELESWESF